MDVLQNDVLENSLMKNDSTNNHHNGEHLLFIDSSDDNRMDKIHSELDVSKNLLNIHTPSPMVARSCFGETNCDSWKNISIYSYTRTMSNGEADINSAFNHGNKFGVYNVSNDSKSMTHNWLNQQVQNCSPEMMRRNDVIFEESTQIDNNGDLDNSDYSDRSQSPANSVSSNDSSDSSSNSSDRSLPDQGSVVSPDKSFTAPAPPSEPESRNVDLHYLFINNNDDDFFAKRYHQPPKAIDREAAKRLARRLFDCDGFKITDVAKHLSKRNDFSQIVGEEFANFFDLTAMRLDGALRLFLSKFTLTGDTQERERIMHHFSKRYVVCNGHMYNGEDACHTLVCALIILNTNLHSQTYPKMSSSDFINNLKDLNDGENFPTENLEQLFAAIEKEPIRWPLDDELVGIVNMNKSAADMIDMSKQLMGTATGYSFGGFDEPRDSNCRDFMSGYVVRKWLKEPGGRKTAFGKRGWKLYYGRLRDLTIYLYKDHDKSYAQPKPPPKRQNSVKKVKVKSSSSMKHQSKKQQQSAGTEKSENPTGVESIESDPSSDPGRTNQANGGEEKSTPDSTTPNSNDKKMKDSTSSPDSPTTPTTVIKTSADNSSDSSTPLSPTQPCSPSTNIQPSLILPPADSEIYIHHAFASRAIDYVKKKNVFRIKTKYGSEYLFQVNNEKEMESWIDNINYVAALLSDPEPIIGISTMEKLSSRSIPRPKITNLNVRNQLESHQKCILELEKIISNLKENPPKKSEKKNRLEFEESIRFREEELLRYKTYSQLLEFEITKLQNLTNMRCIGGGDVPFFCQPYHQSAVLLPNQGGAGIILNGPISDGSGGTAGGSYLTNPLLFSQPNMRYRPPPVLHNLVAISSSSVGGGSSGNRRLRYRAPPALPIGSQSIIAQSGASGGGTEHSIAVTIASPDHPEGSRDPNVFSPAVAVVAAAASATSATTNTFYEIV